MFVVSARLWWGACAVWLSACQMLQARTAQPYGSPLIFEENRGQADPDIRYISRGSQYSLFFTDRDIVFASEDGSEAVKMSLGAANRGTRVLAENRLAGKVNYLYGSDREKWLTNLPTYANLRYPDVYPGIDMLYHADGRQMEFDFAVAPKADPRRIRLHLSGAAGIRISQSGDLLLGRTDGTVVFHKPSVYQKVNDRRIAVDAAFEILDRDTVGFSLGVYDPARALVIDPALSYATYIGPVNENNITGVAMAVDLSGSVYVTGSTSSFANVPVTPGAFQTGVFAGKSVLTGFVTKLNPSGTGLVYATYLGGEGVDALTGVAVDASGSAYVVGGTTSKSFPVSKGAYQTDCTGYCGFVSKLSPDGTSLIYSTYLGKAPGIGMPFITGIALNSVGNAYVAGYTGSSPFPTTPGAFQSSGAAGFVAELDPTGASLVYSTLLGGMGSLISAITVDKVGSAYVTGFITSGFPVTPGAYQSTSGSGFVTKLDLLGSKLVFSTLIGGPGLSDTPSSIAVDSGGNAYIAGLANSGVYPTTPGAYQTKGSGLFVTKFNPTGTGLVYSTFLNPKGSPSGFLPQLAVDGAGSAYVTGLAGGGLPLTTDAFSTTGGGGFLTVLDPAGTSAVYSSYVGGDEGTAIALDAAGSVYIAGAASSGSVPVTTGAFQPKLVSGTTAFVVKFSFPPGTTPVVSGVVNGASSLSGIVPGSFATIFGSNLSPVTDLWNNSIVNGALPATLDGVSVSVAGMPAYVSYVSPGQINFLAPDVGAGPVSVTVTTPAGTSAPYASSAITYQPAFFLIPGNQPVATHLDFTLAAKNGTYPGLTTVPAKPGETIILWGTGFGPTSPAAPTGMVVPSTQTYSTATLPMINISTPPAQVYGAALAPGFAGLYQIAVQVPASIANGDWPVLATIGGVKSETGIVLTVQN
jgi:uncharacterized protein (TIGR03437 family)